MDNVASTYNAIAEQYAAEFSEPTDYLDDFLALLPQGASIVDVGCGPGVELAYCKSKGFVVEGIDLSTEMILLARKRNPDAKISIDDILNFSLLEKAKACIASYSLIHLLKKDVPSALRNIRRNLDEDGFLYVAVHEGQSCETLRSEPFNPELEIFLNIFSKEEIVRFLMNAGFHVIETKSRQALSDEEFPYNKLILLARTKEQTTRAAT